ncbi:MAG: GTP diphosphokinase, partial [Gammaproteobacteria bacterium]|nr:GTP diphosphokinase [Gammaproteobacteria bacterium]
MVTRKKNQVLDKYSGSGIDDWVNTVASRYSDKGSYVIRDAVQMARKAHESQKRASGEPYLSHVIAVADILANMDMDYETVAAALLHDVVEDSEITLEQIRKNFGASIATMVDGVTKLGLVSEVKESKPQKHDKQWANAESLRKMLLAMVGDVRVVLIKLADRLHNLRTLNYLDRNRQQRIAKETLEIFSPLANRLGMWQIKWELEDLSLRYIDPESYKKIAQQLAERRVDREDYIERVIKILNTELQKEGVKGEVTGRPKHIYSIWKKMQKKGVDFHEIFDVRAVRVLVENLADCYAALGVVHSLWRHIPNEFDDYIANPKGNFYRSLHTAVIAPEGKVLEIQIRTSEMHEHAELGVAAHWRYKEGARHDPEFEQKISWLRQLLEWKDEEDSADDFIDRFKAETLDDRVYVLTPNGNVVDLAMGATPLDFAYSIHTDIGHQCRGAKVNGKIVPLTFKLESGMQVEVLTTKTGTPSRDWLNPNQGYLKTSRARAKVRSWFKHQDQEKNISAGRAMFEKELHRLGVSDINLEKLAHHFKVRNPDDLFSAIGRGEITATQIAGATQERIIVRPKKFPVRSRVHQHHGSPDEIHIQGVGNLLTNLARCCKPTPGDPIVGYITQGRGVSVHRSDCSNVLGLHGERSQRLIEVSWGSHDESVYQVDIQILAYDRQGLLGDITAVLSN